MQTWEINRAGFGLNLSFITKARFNLLICMQELLIPTDGWFISGQKSATHLFPRVNNIKILKQSRLTTQVVVAPENIAVAAVFLRLTSQTECVMLWNPMPLNSVGLCTTVTLSTIYHHTAAIHTPLKTLSFCYDPTWTRKKFPALH